MALSITPAEGGSSNGQAATQNPQSVPGGQSISGASNQSGAVQPGTAKTLLTTDSGGVPLGSSTLTTVDLSAQAQPGTQASAAEPPVAKTQHHVNGAFLGICIVLVVAAAVLFWAIGRSAKNTTDW